MDCSAVRSVCAENSLVAQATNHKLLALEKRRITTSEACADAVCVALHAWLDAALHVAPHFAKPALPGW